MLVAEDVLLNDYAEAQTLEEKEELFSLALVDLKGGLGEARIKLEETKDAAQREVLESYLHKLEAIEDMCRAQLAAAKIASQFEVKRSKAAEVGTGRASLPGLREVNEHLSSAIENLHYVHRLQAHAKLERFAFREISVVF